MTTKQQKITMGAIAAIGVVYFAFFHGTDSGDGVDHTGNGSGGTGASFDAHAAATQLYDAMKESGTDEDAVVRILTRITPAQFDQVFTAFGRLAYNPNLGNQWGFGNLARYDLKGWLQSEMPTEYETFRRKFPNRL